MWKILLAISVLVLTGCPMQAQTPQPAVDEFYLENPASGAELFVRLYQTTTTQPVPAVVFVPGGSGAGSQTVRVPILEQLVELGTMAAVFDPDGRGMSSGVEDNNGFIHQDGLMAVIEHLATHPDGDGRVIVVSYSFGVTMASGVLARYPELPVSFYVDWEGPADRNDTGGCDAADVGHLKDAGCENEAFWAEREAATFIRDIQTPYQRVQSVRDHVQPDNFHAILLINRATDRSRGGQGQSPWTRLNDEPPNRTYPLNVQQGLLGENVRADDAILRYVQAYLDGELGLD